MTLVALLLTVLLGAAPSFELASPLDTTLAMRRWAEAHTPRHLSAELRWRRLSTALLDMPGWRIEPAGHRTPTAAEAFASRRINCVGFAHLAVALAREVGVEARFVIAPGTFGAHRRGQWRLEERHLAAAFGTSTRLWVLDQDGLYVARPGDIETIPDSTALAIFHSNRGVEHLLAGDMGAAREWLRRAVRIDPRLVEAVRNLEVVERRWSTAGRGGNEMPVGH